MSNPFGSDATMQDPFQENEIATEISNERYTDDYENPFANNSGYSTVGIGSSNGTRSYFSETNNKSGYSKLSEDDLRIREESLRRREEALVQREQSVDNREVQYRQGDGPVNNWPFKCWSIAYHNIAVDVPSEHQILVKKFYAAVLFTWLCLAWNWLAMIVCVFAGESSHVSADAIWSSIFFGFGVPGSWRFWYRNFYYGVSQKTSARWCTFFLFFAGHIAFSVVMAFGLEATGGSGLFYMISIISSGKHQSTSLLTLIALVLWILDISFSLHLLRKAHETWKSIGQPKRMQQDLARTMVEQGMESGKV